MVSDTWKSELLGNVATLQRGFDLPHRSRKPGKVPIVTSSGIEDTHFEAKVKGPGVVTGRYGTIGEVYFVRDDFWPHNTTLYVRDFHGNDPLFISYLLRTIDFHMHSGKTGVPGVNRNDLHEIIVTLPSTKTEQEAIAEALSDADTLIEALEQILAKKRQVKQGAIQELFTSKRRLPGFSGEWKVKKLGDLCTAIMDGTHFTPKYVNDGIPFYSVENVTANDFKNTKFISLQEHNRLIKRCKPEKGDILMTRIGSLSNTKLIDWDVNASIYVSLALLKFNKQAINGNYLYCYTKSRKFIKDVELRSLINAIPQKINMEDIGEVPILVPSPEEQTAIAEILSDMDAEIAALEGKLSKARQVKQGMMSELLTGRIRLV